MMGILDDIYILVPFSQLLVFVGLSENMLTTKVCCMAEGSVPVGVRL